MSWIQKTEGGKDMMAVESEFHRVTLGPWDQLLLRARDKPVAIWVPSNYQVTITAERETVLDVAEVVEHEDIVSMEKRLREMRNEKRRAEREARRAKRRARQLLERPDRPPREERGG